MQCTPESNVYHKSCKGKHCYDDCSDSGYSGSFQSPRSIIRTDSCQSPVEFSETPKENLQLSVTPKVRTRESVRFSGRDSRGEPRPSAVSWCETPKLYKRGATLRHRLLTCRPTTDVKNDNTRSPCPRKTQSSNSVKSEQWLSSSCDSLDTMIGAFASSTLKPDQDLPLSGRKRRLLFAQVRTSTLEDGKVNSGHLSSFERGVSLTDSDFSGILSPSDQLVITTPGLENSPINRDTNNLCDSSSVLCTPTSAQTPIYIRFV